MSIIWVIPISAYFFDWNVNYVLKKFLLAIDPSQLWFLWMLFGVFVIVWPLKKVLLEKPVEGWLIAIVFYGIGIIGRRILPNVFCIWTACQYVPFFLIGIRIRAKEEKSKKLFIETVPFYCWIIFDIILFVGTMMIGRLNGLFWSLMVISFDFILHIIGSVMAWTSLQVLANKVNWRDDKAFKKLSSYSMPIYLFHQQIIYLTITWLNGVVNPWINAGVNFIVAFIGSILISSLLMHWKYTRMLVGEK